MLRQRNSKKQGDVGLGLAIAYFTGLGCTVSIPLTDSQAYDLIIDDGIIKRVQVKTSTCRKNSGSWSVEMRTKGGNKSGERVSSFDPTAVDIVFIATQSGERYLIPADRINSRSSFTVGLSTAEFRV